MTPALLEFMLEFGRKNDFELILMQGDDTDSRYFQVLANFDNEENPVYTLEKYSCPINDAIDGVSQRYVVDLVAMSGNEKANKIADSLKRPMIIFPDTWQPKEIKRIGFACDNSSFQDSSVLTILWHLAMELKAEVFIIHVSDEPISRWELKSIVEDTIEFYLHDVEHHYDFVHGEDITKALLEYSKLKELDLIATMPRDRGLNRSDQGGQVTNQLVGKSEIPLITID